MKNKSWRQNRPTGQNRNVILKAWNNDMPMRGLNYEKAFNRVMRSRMWKHYYDTYLA